MSQENVEAFKRAVEAMNRRDYEAVLEESDPEVEWHPAVLASLEGQPTVYRGHAGMLEWIRELEAAFGDMHFELSEIRDLGEQLIAVGRLRGRGRGSGAQIETSFAWLVDAKHGKATRIQGYLDPNDALEAAGLSE